MIHIYCCISLSPRVCKILVRQGEILLPMENFKYSLQTSTSCELMRVIGCLYTLPISKSLSEELPDTKYHCLKLNITLSWDCFAIILIVIE